MRVRFREERRTTQLAMFVPPISNKPRERSEHRPRRSQDGAYGMAVPGSPRLMPAIPDSIIMRSSLEAVDARGRQIGRVIEIRRARATGRVTALVRPGRLRRVREVDLTGCRFEPGRVRLAA